MNQMKDKPIFPLLMSMAFPPMISMISPNDIHVDPVSLQCC